MFKKIRKRLRKRFSRKEVPSSLTFDDPTVWYELKYLNLSNCEIATLPKELGALSDLEKLVLSNNGFGASNKFEWHWLRQTAIQNSLRFLDLSKNSLTELPACIGMLSALTELIVCHNSLTYLPQSIKNLRNLQVLRLSNNNFGASDNFKWHWLRSTAIQNNLRFLDLSKNSITELPVCIGMLSALTELIVCHNSLTCFPQSIGNLQNLQILRSSNNNLGASDKFKWHWLRSTAIRNNLRFLDLSKNSLTVLPACIGYLSALTELIVCHNSLTCLPQTIGDLQNLQVLRSSNNKLLYLPGNITNIRLKILDVSTNAFFTFEATVVHASLLTLRSLAAKVFLENRLTCCDRDITHACLEHLENAVYCPCCDTPLFESHIRDLPQLNPLWFTDTTIWDREKNDFLPFEYFFCRPACDKYVTMFMSWIFESE